MSVERQLSQEAKAMLPQVSERVAMQYAVENGLHMNRSFAITDDRWERLAGNFPPFSETITLLRQRLRVADEIKVNYPDYVTAGIVGQFGHLVNPYARSFLGDILISRMASFGSVIDGDVGISEEAAKMAQELGLEHGWQSQKAKMVSYKQVVDSVLTGAMQIASHRSQSPRS